MKKKNIFLPIIIISFILIILGIGIFLLINYSSKQTTIGFSSQCSLPSCPSGYTDAGSSCSDSSNKCTRTCTKQLDGSCGSYGSFSQVESGTRSYTGSINRGVSYNTPFYNIDDSHCYKFYVNTFFSTNSWGTADSFSVYASDTWDSQTVCSVNTASSATTQTHTLGRGSSGSSYSGAGEVIDYGGSTCSGGYPIFELKGTMNIYLYASVAPWVAGGIDTQTETCTYQCDNANDCGTNGFTGSTYCKNNNVYQMYRTYSCSNYVCSQNDVDTLSTTCSNGCANSACITVACNNGDVKCDGTTYFTCSANNWVSQGNVAGKCNYNCATNDIILNSQDNNYYICSSGSYQKILDIIELPLAEQQKLLDLINQLNGTVQQKAQIINDLTTTLEGQITIINQLNDSIQEKAQIINNLQLNLNQQEQMISELNANLADKAVIISNLKLNIQQQVDIISQLTQKSNEQVEIINNLNLTITQQAQMINALTSNLNDKIYLVLQLQSGNEQQAQLISQMQLSLSNQSAILDGLNKEISDDAEIISNLNLNIKQQGELISNLTLTNQEKAQLISELNLKISDQATLISSLNDTIKNDAEIISNLNLSLDQESDLITQLQLTTEQDAILIANLKLSVADEETLVSQLRSTITEQQSLINQINAEKSKIQNKNNLFIWIIIIVSVIALIFLILLGIFIAKKKR